MTSTTSNVKFHNWAGTFQTTPTTDMKFFLYVGGGEAAINPQNVAPASSDIWLFGVFEV